MKDHIPRYFPRDPLDPQVNSVRCVASVHGPGRGIFIHQCARLRLPGTEWCRQHSPEVVASKRSARYERWDAERRNDPGERAIRYKAALQGLMDQVTPGRIDVIRAELGVADADALECAMGRAYQALKK